uniref:Uncharacterized protein n=1 Tax=Neogobius melanostomus TaxID=47308 RepID=A0A8C6T301_9GOBI
MAITGSRSLAASVLFHHHSSISPERTGKGAPQKIDHAVIGRVVALVMFAILCALIVLGQYVARHKGTYFTHKEADLNHNAE